MIRHPPDILITTPESLYLMLTSRAREIFAGTEAVIVDEIHAVAQTKRGAHMAITLERLRAGGRRPVQRIGLSATQNPLEEVGRFLVGPKRTCRVVDAGVRKPLDLKIHVPVESMVEPEQTRRRARPVRGRRGDPQVDLAGDLPEILELVQSTVDDRLRQQPPRRRAARAAAQRARLPGRPGRAAGRDRPRAPRLAGARGAARDRGPAQGRRAAVPGRDLEPRARHRHGRRRPRAAGRVAEVGHRAACSGSAAPATTSATPPRAASSPSSAPTCSSARSSPSACARARSRRPSSRATRSTCSPSRSSRWPPRADDEDQPLLVDDLHALLSRTHSFAELSRAAARERARHARRPLPERGVRRAAPAHRLGPRGRHAPRPQGRARAGDHQRRHDPRPRAVLASTCPTAAASASSTRRWSTRRARARRSCSAPRAGGSRRSRATA